MKHSDRRYRVEPQTHAAYEVSDSFRTGAVTGYREGMLNLFNLFGLERLAHLSQFHIVLFYVLLFHVLHFHVLPFGPSFSRPAISCPAHWSFNFMSCNFMPCKLVRQFHVRHFHVQHFQRPHTDKFYCSIGQYCILRSVLRWQQVQNTKQNGSAC